jgi:hypothetical protein
MAIAGLSLILHEIACIAGRIFNEDAETHRSELAED